ncbi:MAG: 50S ribosomal protein L9 [Candidatus Paraimprobicoccus trichonymphae]|uniref:Large ribosomal subunit protein bL9 n=1 Tax=Candidatus Paraimprobicoccus trichonymphae TaxID=3033793 RepID=A0AA48I3Q1_9FIRM|nr:MAG: 50S ribosomal protein L9 [Candidatus Paraimprobicoccus trichonymphae]
MKVILLENVGSEKKGTVKEVKPGYARNFLLRNNLAKIATSKNLKDLENLKKAEEYKKELEKQDFIKISEAIDGKEIEIKTKVGETGKLFGSVTSKEITEKINEMFFLDIDKRKVCLPEDINSTGRHKIEIRFANDISSKIFVNVTEE